MAIDARDLQQRPLRGSGRVLANVLPSLRNEADVELLTHPGGPTVDLGVPEHRLASPIRQRRLWLDVAVRPWLRGFDGVFHGPFYAIPHAPPTPTVVTIHDLSFEHHPEWFGRSWSAVYRRAARHAARTADCVITVSEFVADELTERYGLGRDRIVVAPNGVDPRFTPIPGAHDGAVLERLGITRPYLVTLGGAARRNAGAAIDAWHRLRRRGHDLRLVVVGEEATPIDGVTSLIGLDDPDWVVVLRHADALLWPTRYEGFGLPGLEAMAAGTPVVAVRVASLPEVLGSGVAWAQGHDPERLADAVEQVVTQSDFRRQLVDRGRQRAAEAGSWDPAVRAYLDAYARAAA